MNEHLSEAEMLRRIREEEAAPETPPYLAAKIWARIEPELQPYRAARRGWFSARAAWMLAAALMAIVSFAGGRWWEKASQPARAEQAHAAADRILLTAAADHLERCQRFLTELQMERRANPELARTARELLNDNRLYLQSAAYAKDATLGDVLDRMGRVLTEVAHSGAGVPGLVQGDWRLKDLAKALRTEQRRSPLRA